jgi:hypothetical protein
LFARIDGFVNEINPIRVSGIQKDTGIKRIVNRMGSEDLVERRIELFQKDTEKLTVGSGGAWRDQQLSCYKRFSAYFLLVKNTRYKTIKKNEYLYSIEGRRRMLLNKLSFGQIKTQTQGYSIEPVRCNHCYFL